MLKYCTRSEARVLYIYIYIIYIIYIYILYIYRKSAGRFSRGTVLNTLEQSRINIMRGKKDVTTFPDKPVSWIASLFRGLMKEYSYDYRLYTRKICIIRGKLKNFKVQLLRSNVLFIIYILYIYLLFTLIFKYEWLLPLFFQPETKKNCKRF